MKGIAPIIALVIIGLVSAAGIGTFFVTGMPEGTFGGGDNETEQPDIPEAPETPEAPASDIIVTLDRSEGWCGDSISGSINSNMPEANCIWYLSYNDRIYNAQATVALDTYGNYNLIESPVMAGNYKFKAICAGIESNVAEIDIRCGCYETDGGNNVYEKGTCENRDGIQEDSCIGEMPGWITEVWCSGDNILGASIQCPNQGYCENGECKDRCVMDGVTRTNYLGTAYTSCWTSGLTTPEACEQAYFYYDGANVDGVQWYYWGCKWHDYTSSCGNFNPCEAPGGSQP